MTGNLTDIVSINVKVRIFRMQNSSIGSGNGYGVLYLQIYDVLYIADA